MTPHRWRRLRQISQVVAFLLFASLVVLTYQRASPGWSALFVRLDPLLTLGASVAGRTLIAGFWLALITVALTLLFGRVWCGWLCPLGTLLDWITPRKQARNDRNRLPNPPERWRTVKYLVLLLILFAAALGNLTLFFLDPITLSIRSLSAAIWPALGQAVYGVEDALYGFQSLWPVLDRIDQWFVYPLFRGVRSAFLYVVPVFALLATIVALNWWAPRFWCRYLCPLGAMLGFLSKWALVRREVDDNCIGCSLCARRCPTGTIDPDRGFRSDPAECIVCFDCVADCPQAGVAFRRVRGWHGAERLPYDPGRREVLLGLGGAAVGVSLLQIEPAAQNPALGPLRPPGATLVDFGDLCIRCGLCIRTCPTQGLQPTLLEGGWQHLFTPQLVPRQGYCLYGCTACADVCPTGAIPPLPAEEKQRTAIGLASVNTARCLPWAYDTPCIVCEEMCPVPDKAIQLEEVEVVTETGDRLILQRPSVVREKCIGCGICEHKCPMEGEAAIRVYPIAQPA